MIRYRTSDRAPHLVIELEGTIDEEEIHRTFTALPSTLSSLPAGFVLLTTYVDVVLFQAHALGPLFYNIVRIFDADPQLCVFVDGTNSPYPGLRQFIEQVGLADQVAFVPSRADADDHIQASVRSAA